MIDYKTLSDTLRAICADNLKDCTSLIDWEIPVRDESGKTKGHVSFKYEPLTIKT